MMVFSKSMGEPRSMFVYHHFWWVLPHLLWTDEELDPREASDIKHIVPKSSRQGDMTWALCVTGEPSESDYPVLLPYLTSAFSLPTSSSHSSLELYFISYSWVSSSGRGCAQPAQWLVHFTYIAHSGGLGWKAVAFISTPSQRGAGSGLKRRVSSGSVDRRGDKGQHPGMGLGFRPPFLKSSTAHPTKRHHFLLKSMPLAPSEKSLFLLLTGLGPWYREMIIFPLLCWGWIKPFHDRKSPNKVSSY